MIYIPKHVLTGVIYSYLKYFLDNVMLDWTNCVSTNEKGNIFSWDDSNRVQSISVKNTEEELSDICTPETLGISILPARRTYQSSITACR